MNALNKARQATPVNRPVLHPVPHEGIAVARRYGYTSLYCFTHRIPADICSAFD
jgi:hypothetical protein